jgi:hypothetical protein
MKPLNKTVINFWLDCCLLVLFLLLCWISVTLRYVFPVATQSTGWTLWGIDYLGWTDLQFASLCLMLAAVLLHVMLHWSWVCGVLESWQRKRQGRGATGKSDTGQRTLWGVGLLIVLLNLLGIGVAAAALAIQGPTL